MSRWLDRNFRHYLWIDDVIYVIDDLHSHEPGTFEVGVASRRRGREARL